MSARVCVCVRVYVREGECSWDTDWLVCCLPWVGSFLRDIIERLLTILPSQRFLTVGMYVYIVEVGTSIRFRT